MLLKHSPPFSVALPELALVITPVRPVVSPDPVRLSPLVHSLVTISVGEGLLSVAVLEGV